jgi:3-oxoadipate enol-lactonase/4-carboxymuconolactone decarboxylase
MTVTLVDLGGRPDQPLLVLGPSLGTTVAALWGAAAELLAADFHVVGWDLPGHGSNRARVDGVTTLPDLASDLLDALAAVGDGTVGFHYAGDSVGGAVGLQLLLDAPDRVLSATLCCTAAYFGGADPWEERIATVSSSGTPALVAASSERWFAPGFFERHPERGSALLHALSDADDAGYLAVCAALGAFDVRDRLEEIDTSVLTVAGAHDRATPPEALALIADRVARGRSVVLPEAAHQVPVECPETIARLIREHALGERDRLTRVEVRAAGMEVRRAVLGDAHVDRATASATPLTEEFQRFITEYAWGSVWTRPGLDRRSRSMITLTALVALGHEEELALHLRAARRNGLTDDEIKELLLQTAIYCGVPAANTAFRIAQKVLAEESP